MLNSVSENKFTVLFMPSKNFKVDNVAQTTVSCGNSQSDIALLSIIEGFSHQIALDTKKAHCGAIFQLKDGSTVETSFELKKLSYNSL